MTKLISKINCYKYKSGGDITNKKDNTSNNGVTSSNGWYHVNPADYQNVLNNVNNNKPTEVKLPTLTVTAADPKNYRSSYDPNGFMDFMNLFTLGASNRLSVSQNLRLAKDTYDAISGNKSWKDVFNSAVFGNQGVFKNPWANLALDVVVPATSAGVYKLSTLKNTAKNSIKNSTVTEADKSAMSNYEKLGAKPLTLDEAATLNRPDYIMPLYKMDQPKDVKELYPEMLRRMKDNFNVESKDLTKSFKEQSETPIYVGKYSNPDYVGTHMNTGESYISLNDNTPVSTILHEAARHGTEDAIKKYSPEAWKGYTDFIDTLQPYMGYMITESSRDPAELRATLGELYLKILKLVKQAYTEAYGSQLPERLRDESINQYDRFGTLTNYHINSQIKDKDILDMLDHTNAYGQDYAEAIRYMKENPIEIQEAQNTQKNIDKLQKELANPNISKEDVTNIQKHLYAEKTWLNILNDRIATNQKLYNQTMNKLRELLTKYPMFTGAAAVGAGYGVTKHKNGGKMKIHIKKKNRGKFTSYCGGKVTQSCIDRAKASGNAKLVKRAIFAENSRHWNRGIKKGSEGMLIRDPPDSSFESLAKKSGSRSAAAPILKKIYYDVKKQGATEQQAAAATITAAFESHGNYKAKHGQFKGLGQWDASRYPGNYNAQIKELSGKDKSKWVRDGYNTFMHTQSTPADTTRVYTKDFIRGGNPITRAKIAQELFGMTNNY